AQDALSSTLDHNYSSDPRLWSPCAYWCNAILATARFRNGPPMLIGYWLWRLTISTRRFGVSGRLTSATPSASATALAMHTGALIEFPSATPLAPSGVTGDGVSWCKISRSGIIEAVGSA